MSRFYPKRTSGNNQISASHLLLRSLAFGFFRVDTAADIPGFAEATDFTIWPSSDVSHRIIQHAAGPKISPCQWTRETGILSVSGGPFSNVRILSRPRAISSSTNSFGMNPHPIPARSRVCFQPISAVRNCRFDTMTKLLVSIREWPSARTI